MRPRSDRRLYYVEAMASAARVIGAPARDPVVAILLADSGFRRAFAVVRQLQRERRLLLRPTDDALHRELAKELERRLADANAEADRRIQYGLGGQEMCVFLAYTDADLIIERISQLDAEAVLDF